MHALALVGTLGIVPMGAEARAAISSRFGTVTREGIERKLRTVLFDPDLVTPAWIEEEWRINNSPGAHEAFSCIADYIRDGIDDDVVGEQLAALDRSHSTAMIWGVQDNAVPVSVGHRCRQVLQPALYEEIPETGHGPYLEKPQVFNQMLAGFLAREDVYPAAQLQKA